jgi:hypothetical protein
VGEYSVSARLHSVTYFDEGLFRRHLATAREKLRRFSPVIGGAPSQYDVTAHIAAATPAAAATIWWAEVEPLLEQERLGSMWATYTQLPRVVLPISADVPPELTG